MAVIYLLSPFSGVSSAMTGPNFHCVYISAFVSVVQKFPRTEDPLNCLMRKVMREMEDTCGCAQRCSSADQAISISQRDAMEHSCSGVLRKVFLMDPRGCRGSTED